MALEGGLEVEVTGGAVEFVFTVANVGDEPVSLEFRSGLAADIAVHRGDEELWRWSDGQLFTQALWSESLDADESVTYEATWSDPDPGTYDVIASLEASNADLEARTSFDV